MRRRDDINFDRQLQQVDGAMIAPSRLALVHVTAAWPAKEILRVGKLVTKHCRVFKKQLIYFFILRPSYRNKIGNEESHQVTRFPMAFVFDHSAVPNPYQVYPFDTGGAVDGAFNGQADPYIPLEDYALLPNYENVGKFISSFFGNSENYFRGSLRPDLANDLPIYASVAISYADIARMGVDGSNEHDTRASSIEVAASHNVELMGKVRLIVAPKQYIDGNKPVSDLLNDLKANGTRVKVYDWQANRKPNEYQSDIFRIVEEWYRAENIL